MLSDQYQKVFNGMNERHQQSRANRRRGGGRRRDDLKDGAYKMPQIVIEQEPFAAACRDEGKMGVCVYAKSTPILYKRDIKLTPFCSRPFGGGTPP